MSDRDPDPSRPSPARSLRARLLTDPAALDRMLGSGWIEPMRLMLSRPGGDMDPETYQRVFDAMVQHDPAATETLLRTEPVRDAWLPKAAYARAFWALVRHDVDAAERLIKGGVADQRRLAESATAMMVATDFMTDMKMDGRMRELAFARQLVRTLRFMTDAPQTGRE